MVEILLGRHGILHSGDAELAVRQRLAFGVRVELENPAFVVYDRATGILTRLSKIAAAVETALQPEAPIEI